MYPSGAVDSERIEFASDPSLEMRDAHPDRCAGLYIVKLDDGLRSDCDLEPRPRLEI